MYAEEVDDMRRMFGVRHLRYYYWRLRVERQALRYYLRGEGLRPGEGQMRALLAIWYGECRYVAEPHKWFTSWLAISYCCRTIPDSWHGHRHVYQLVLDDWLALQLH